MLAPGLHTGTDAREWLHGGFTPTRLWLNYVAFVPLPAAIARSAGPEGAVFGRFSEAGHSGMRDGESVRRAGWLSGGGTGSILGSEVDP